MINELSLMWHISRCTLNEMTRLILWFLFMIHVKPAAFFIFPLNPHVSEPFSALIIYNTIISFHRRSTLKPKRFFLLRYVTDIRFPIYYSQKGFLGPFTSTDAHGPMMPTITLAGKNFLIPRFYVIPPENPRSTQQMRLFFFLLHCQTNWRQLNCRTELYPKFGENHNKLLRSGSLIVSLQNAGHFFSPVGPSASRSSRTFVNSSCSTTFTLCSADASLRSRMNENVSFHPHFIRPTVAIARLFYRIFVSSHSVFSEGRRRAEAKECGGNNIYRSFNTCKDDTT